MFKNIAGLAKTIHTIEDVKNNKYILEYETLENPGENDVDDFGTIRAFCNIGSSATDCIVIDFLFEEDGTIIDWDLPL